MIKIGHVLKLIRADVFKREEILTANHFHVSLNSQKQTVDVRLVTLTYLSDDFLVDLNAHFLE